MTDTKDEREAILNESLANQSPRQLYERAIRAERREHEALQAAKAERNRGDRQKRRADALERALRPFAEAVYNDNGDLTIRPCGIDEYYTAKRAYEGTALAQQEPDQPAELIGGEVGREFGADQPAQDGGPSCCDRTREEERERCARIADTMKLAGSTSSTFEAGANWAALKIAERIRRTDGDTP
jgi:hypothetical protein